LSVCTTSSFLFPPKNKIFFQLHIHFSTQPFDRKEVRVITNFPFSNWTNTPSTSSSKLIGPDGSPYLHEIKLVQNYPTRTAFCNGKEILWCRKLWSGLTSTRFKYARSVYEEILFLFSFSKKGSAGCVDRFADTLIRQANIHFSHSGASSCHSNIFKRGR
jgi:hypothetical protein